ncbi:MAG: RNA polymerase sigma factor [Acholeplasmataceae bacterium]
MNDKLAVKKLQNKDERGFDYLYHKYVRLIFHIIFSMVENKEVANDLVQDTYIKVYRKINTFDPNNNIKYWIITIAKNLTIDYLRKNNKIIKDYNIDLIPSYDSSEKSDFHDILLKYENILTKDEYSIITLHLYEGLKFREISTIYGKTISSVNNIYIRGINKIKKHLKDGDVK